jgi:Protein of unknown function (DUF2934)
MKTVKTETQDSVQRGSEPNTSGRTTRVSHSQMQETSMHEDITKLAYALWHQRGCPQGSPEFDWLEAERTLRESSEHVSR